MSLQEYIERRARWLAREVFRLMLLVVIEAGAVVAGMLSYPHVSGVLAYLYPAAAVAMVLAVADIAYRTGKMVGDFNARVAILSYLSSALKNSGQGEKSGGEAQTPQGEAVEQRAARTDR